MGIRTFGFLSLGTEKWQLPVSGYLDFASFQGRCVSPPLSHSPGVETISYFADSGFNLASFSSVCDFLLLYFST